jgi:hypothetical protein
MTLDDESKQWLCIGVAWFLILIGFGGCCALIQVSQKTDKPIVKIETK